jgi:murein DD-endopeptidase MepM/ murein hydrolase activator NlpD
MLPSKADLDSMYRFQTPPQEFQAWERREDAILKNYLGPGDHIGVPWSNTSGTPPISPTAEPIVRGNGHFLDLRRDSRYPGGYRFHGGTDYLTQVGDPIFAIAEGAITRVFIASADGARAGLTALEIRMNNGYTAQYLYVKPADEIARRIAARQFPIPVASGTVIGTSQDLHTLWKDKKGVTHPAYPMSVEQHLHLTLKDPNGRYVSPDGTGVLVMKKGERPKVESPRPRGKPH